MSINHKIADAAKSIKVSATSSPHYTFLADEVLPAITVDRQHLFIDLAVPKDIDPDVANIPNCIIKDVDYIKDLAKENNEKKYCEAEKIKLLIKDKKCILWMGMPVSDRGTLLVTKEASLMLSL